MNNPRTNTMVSPRLEILLVRAEKLGPDTWRIEAGVANTGFLPTQVSHWARKHDLVLPAFVELTGADSIGPSRQRIGQLSGRSHFALNGPGGTPDRTLVAWVVRAGVGDRRARTRRPHERAPATQLSLTGRTRSTRNATASRIASRSWRLNMWPPS